MGDHLEQGVQRTDRDVAGVGFGPRGGNDVQAARVPADENAEQLSIQAEDIDTGKMRTFFGEDFWRQATDDGFGDYSIVGDQFGQSDVFLNGRHWFVQPAAYKAFKQQQMKLAVRATLRGLINSIAGRTSARFWTAAAPGRFDIARHAAE